MPSIHLRRLIADIVGPEPTRAGISRFVALAYDLSRAYVRATRNAAVIESVLFRNRSRDLALDLIADLFERDVDGYFTRIRDFYLSADWEELDEEMLWRRTKSLVLGQINDALFSLYGDADRSLARIIRNLKRVVSRIDDVDIVRRPTGLCLVTGRDEGPRPTASYEELEVLIAPHVNEIFDLEQIVRRTCRDLASVDRLACELPLTQFALCLRNARVRQHLPLARTGDAPSAVQSGDLNGMISRAVRGIRNEKKDFYIRSERLTDVEFERVVSAIELRLQAMADLNDLDISSNLDSMCEVSDGLTEPRYRDRYRNIYEYLFKLTRERLVKLLEIEGFISADRT
jgi:hypothetical protein